ncbi:MAG: hypothetical protein D6692_02285 [Planctomycetota bacterium]|nr:MAG: hypothetical protein D6692_02285 [Planctomycetota bacterium]
MFKGMSKVLLVGVACGFAASVSWGQEVVSDQTLVASPVSPGGLFGVSVSYDSGLLAVGASDDSLTADVGGAVYLFERQGGVWVQTARLESSDLASMDFLGYSVGVSGDTVVAGAWGDDDGGSLSGSVYVFERDFGGADAWVQRAKIVNPAPAANDVFGSSVAIDGDTLVVGAPLDNQGGILDRGTVSVYRRDSVSGQWVLERVLVAPDANPDGQFGFSLAIDGDRLVVGSIGSNAQGNGAGAAYVFERNLGGPGQWGLAATLRGSDIDANDQFGYSVTVDGDRVVVGANKKDRDGLFAGAVFVFERDGAGVWSEAATFRADNPVNLQEFGSSVSLAGDTLLVGAMRTPASLGSPGGAAFVYARDAQTGVWSLADTISTIAPGDGDLLGSSVAIRPDGDGGWFGFVGARGDGGPDAPLTGSVRALVLSSDLPCPADLAAPFGLLNVFDIQAYVGLYNTMDPAADLAAPFGSFNIFDLQAYINLYNAGCP